MEYLYKEDIILINRKTVERHGGNFVPPSNFLNEEPLNYLIEAVQSEMFGKPLYPEIHDKAGLYMFNIISNHVFQDGNKRAGLGAALLFLRLNGFELREEFSMNFIDILAHNDKKSNIEGLIEFTLDLAAGKITLEECQQLFKKNIIEAI